MSLNSIFENLVVIHSNNVAHQTVLIQQFCEEFTYIKKNTPKVIQTEHKHYTTGISRTRRKSESGEPIFEYEVLKNKREDDPYLKILFHTTLRKKEGEREGSMSSTQKELVPSEEQRR